MIGQLFLLIACITFNANGHAVEVVGYWENWVDVDWWQNNLPGNCLMGCVKPDAFMTKIADYSVVNYGFSFLTQNPNPDMITCGNSSANCPLWDGNGIYVAQATKQGATLVNAASTISTISSSPGLIAISEVCRLARQGPAGPRRCMIVLGGWSDWARIGGTANAQKIAKLVGKMVLFSFADGVDLDFEHLTEFSYIDKTEFDSYIALVQAIRTEFNSIKSSWVSTAETRYNDLKAEYDALPDWQKNESPYYATNMDYMQQVQKNGAPYLAISFTTRFNAFLNASNPFNYLDPTSPKPPPFATDNEGAKLWGGIGGDVDNVNVMVYDGGSPAGPLKFNFEQILMNFNMIGTVPKDKINIGFEPGDQAAGGVWEGLDKDVEVTKYVKQNAYGGAMVWAINPSAANSAQWCPVVAKNVFSILQPGWPYGTPPVYSKCNPSTGWKP